MRNMVFCDLAIIEKIITDFFETRNNIEADDLTTSLHWYLLLGKYSELIIDSTKSDFIELASANPIINLLLKKSDTGGSKLSFWKGHTTEMEKEQRYLDFPNSFFLLNCSDLICKQKINEHGLLFLNGNTYKSFTDKLFYITDLNVNKNKSKSDISCWSDLKKIAIPLNCLILTDNYIMKENSDLENNLIPLLDTFLPAQLQKATFNLMIITQEMPENDFSKRYVEMLLKITSKLSRPYEIILTLITTKISKNHDRRIFTNYSRLESNNSFTYFDKNGIVQKNTTLHSFPSSMIASGKELMLKKNMNILAEVKDIVKNARQSKGPISSESNRLLALVAS